MKGILVAGAIAGAMVAKAEDFKPSVNFSGYMDGDFKTLFSKDFEDPNHTYGLELKLTSTIAVSENVKGYLYTAAYDGIVPGQGSNLGTPPVQFDGFTLDWEAKPGKHIYFGDQIVGQGFFNYYFYKRSAGIISKHWVRGFGASMNGFYIQSGADLKPNAFGAAPLSAGTTWSTFAKYDLSLGTNMTLTPFAKYTAGIPGIAPVNLGVSYVGKMGGLTLNAHAGYNQDFGRTVGTTDAEPGFTLLVEPIFATGPLTLSATVFWDMQGDVADGKLPSITSQPKGSYGAYALGYPEDLLVYLEPDYTVNSWLTVGSTFEYHNYKSINRLTYSPGDEIWIVPTVYIAPAKGVTVIPYGQVYLAGTQGHTGVSYPFYQFGSEVVFNF